MADLIYKLPISKPGYYQFTMPDGFESNVQIYTWGAGGGNGSGAGGSGGGHARSSNISISSGTVVGIVVGGKGGDASGPSAGSAGSGASIGYRGGSGANQGDPEDGDAGGSGGGGGASAVLVNGAAVVVAGGGGGGGGYGEDGAGGATAGYPGGVYVGQATGVYPVTLSYAWCGFMNSYAVWGNGQDYTVVLNFPVTGTYTFNYSVDNYGQVYLDGSSVISYSTFTTYTSYTQTVSAGNHTVRVTGVNTGGPAGVALQILKPDSSELWNTRALTVSDGLTDTTNGQNGTRGGAGGSGGGGGGYRGGETGVAYGDDQIGGQGGNGGLNYGDVIESGVGTTGAGLGPKLAYSIPRSIGNAGYDGYVLLILTRKLRLYNKVDNGNVAIVFSGNITANIVTSIVTQSVSNATFIPYGATGGNTLIGTYFDANVFTLGSGNVSVVDGNITTPANVYPVSSTAQGDWTNINKVYWKATRPGTLSNVFTKTFSTVGATGGSYSQTFSTPGSQPFIVPTGVSSLTVTLNGAGGGSDASAAWLGGAGGLLSFTLPVTAGQVLALNIGGRGNQGQFSRNGGGGGGSTGISYGSIGGALIAIAGGGGGGGGAGGGGPYGTVGGAGGGNGSGAAGGTGGSSYNGNPGQGGTQSAGGLGGANINRGHGSGTAGSTGQGGAGGNDTGGSGSGGGGGVPGGGNGGSAAADGSGGGGGGGYFGGGGGSADIWGSGGGGGSGYLNTSIATQLTSTQGGGAASDTNGSVTISYTAVGSAGVELWTVPTGVTKLTVSYPTPAGFVTQLFPVTAGETISVKLGNFGQPSTITGLSGVLSLPAYDTQVFSYSGNVDHIIAQDVQVATATPTSYTGSGSNSTLTAGATAAGITYNVTYEGWHGDLGATISITPVPISTLIQPVQVYVKSGSGRQFPSAHTYQQQPSAANGYIMNDYQGDYYGGEGGYSWTTNIQQQGYISITYDKAYNIGEWIEVNQIYYKDASWKPLITNTTISLTKLS